MATTIRHDFSFPPKSNSLNNNRYSNLNTNLSLSSSNSVRPVFSSSKFNNQMNLRTPTLSAQKPFNKQKSNYMAHSVFHHQKNLVIIFLVNKIMLYLVKT
jgi:hypothetical protein